MEQKKTWAQNNQSIVELLGYFVIIVIMFVSIIALIIYGFHLASLDNPIIDEASGKEIDPKNYGSVETWKLSVIGFEALKTNYSAEAQAKIVQTLQSYFSATHPNGKKISYMKDSLKDNSFKVVVSDTYTYDVSAVVNSDNTIKLDIKEDGSNIFNYKIINYTTMNLTKSAIDSFSCHMLAKPPKERNLQYYAEVKTKSSRYPSITVATKKYEVEYAVPSTNG